MITFPFTMFSGAVEIYENLLSTLFNGVNDEIHMPNSASLNITNNLTMACWVKTTGVQDASFMSKYKTGTNERQYFIGQLAAGGLRVLVSSDGGATNTKDYNSTEVINDGKWHFVAATFVTNVLKLYIDGEEITPVKVTDATVNSLAAGSTSGLQFSSIEGSPSLFEFAGNIDEAAIWDTTVLTSAEITDIYNNNMPKNLLIDSGNYVSSANLVGYWRMGDGDSATTVFDQTSLGNDGTLLNMSDSDYVSDVPIAKFSTESLSFNGVDEYLSATYDVSQDAGAAYSYSTWIKPTANGTVYLASRWGAGGSRAWYMNLTASGYLAVVMTQDGSTANVYSTGTVLAFDVWTHVTWTFDGGAQLFKLYYDSVEVASVATVETSIFTSTNDLYIGAISTPAISGYYLGEMDDTAAFDKTLSLAEVQEIYETGRPSDLNESSISADLISYWDMAESFDGATVTGLANAIDLTSVNMTVGNKSDEVP